MVWESVWGIRELPSYSKSFEVAPLVLTCFSRLKVRIVRTFPDLLAATMRKSSC
jgi:hypothetical protein